MPALATCRILSLAAIAMAAASTAGHAARQGQTQCVLAGGEAVMITRGLAEFMAQAALKNSIKGMQAQPAGPIKLTCDAPAPLTHCEAKQRACK